MMEPKFKPSVRLIARQRMEQLSRRRRDNCPSLTVQRRFQLYSRTGSENIAVNRGVGLRRDVAGYPSVQ